MKLDTKSIQKATYADKHLDPLWDPSGVVRTEVAEADLWPPLPH